MPLQPRQCHQEMRSLLLEDVIVRCGLCKTDLDAFSNLGDIHDGPKAKLDYLGMLMMQSLSAGNGIGCHSPSHTHATPPPPPPALCGYPF